ncbi:MAG TPA: histidine phosphatase family protein [Thermoplasmata archaeon]|nr:histidine phosphatase family protein [Thermoplasmata archaeon]
MRTLEHRRHSRRDASGVQLNPEGRALARKVGGSMPRFDRVITSPKRRAVETATALGFPVDATEPALGEMPDDAGVPFEPDPPRTFEEYARWAEQSRAMGEFARSQAHLWERELERVPEGGALLMISHSGVVEAGAVAALPRVARTWGPLLGYLEGVRLRWDGTRWVSGEVLRVPE